MQTPLKRRKLFDTVMTPMLSTVAMGNSATVSKGKRFAKLYPKKNKKLAQFIKAVVRSSAEKKERLISLASTLNATQSNVILLNGIAEGNDYNQRVGREITSSYIEINLAITTNASSGAGITGDCGFWAIVLDRDPTAAGAAVPGFGTIFDDSIGGQQGLDFRITTSNQDRFQIVSRNEWSAGNTGAFTASVQNGSGAQPYHVKEYIDLAKILQGKDKSTQYNTTTSVYTALDSSSLLFVVAGALSSANCVTTVVGQSKYRFTDV